MIRRQRQVWNGQIECEGGNSEMRKHAEKSRSGPTGMRPRSQSWVKLNEENDNTRSTTTAERSALLYLGTDCYIAQCSLYKSSLLVRRSPFDPHLQPSPINTSMYELSDVMMSFPEPPISAAGLGLSVPSRQTQSDPRQTTQPIHSAT